jgi:cytochrome c oxidase assembly protein subunit 15
VVALGAYTRLQDAGLGCPDWPGCYGHLLVPKSEHAINHANANWPQRPLQADKAWPEMIHRYFASTLGFVVLVILILSLRARAHQHAIPLLLPVALAILVVFQGLLGMWTVTLGLFPTIVMAHLLGGFSTVCLLFLLAVRLHQSSSPKPPSLRRQHPIALGFGILGIAVLTLQIALGGWTAANYAARVCSDLPICQSGWQQHINLGAAFQLWGHGITNYEFATHLGADAKITIHVAHRIGAIITGLYLGLFLTLLLVRARVATIITRSAGVALCFLCLQIALGISNVVLDLPLSIAVAHNAVAAILMMSLIYLNLCLYRTIEEGTHNE